MKFLFGVVCGFVDLSFAFLFHNRYQTASPDAGSTIEPSNDAPNDTVVLSNKFAVHQMVSWFA